MSKANYHTIVLRTENPITEEVWDAFRRVVKEHTGSALFIEQHNSAYPDVSAFSMQKRNKEYVKEHKLKSKEPQ
jgi:hypothetical protein